jgi:hypothetical protein
MDQRIINSVKAYYGKDLVVTKIRAVDTIRADGPGTDNDSDSDNVTPPAKLVPLSCITSKITIVEFVKIDDNVISLL